MKKQLVSLALFLASTALFAQSPQATVTATKQSYSGGTVTATFAPLGTGSPSVTVVTGTINANGFFSVLVWNNTFFSYAPSVTQFQICGAAPNSGTCYTASVTITGNQDISSAFNGAPNPASSSGGGAPINSPAFTGNPTAPTQACGNNTGLATLAYVQNCAPSAPVSSVFGSTGAVVAALGQYNLSLIGAGATGAGLYDFSAATNLKLPVAAGYAATASGECGHDSTSHNFHCFDNAVDNFMALFPSSSPPTSGHMAGFLQAGNGAWTLQDLGLPGSSLWSGLGTPTGNLALTMAAFTSTYTYNAATGSADLFKLTDTVNNTGLGIMQHITTASGSTEIPWQADANGVGYQVNASGQMVGIGQTFPGYHSFQNGSGTLPNLPSGSGGWVAPVSGGTPWLGQLPATITAGILHFATPASVYGVNVSQVTSSPVALADMATEGANTTLANVTGGTAVPTAAAIPSGIQNYVAGTGYNQATAHQVHAPLICADTSGSGTAQICTTSPTFVPAANDCVVYTTTTANSGALTLNVNSSAADAVQKWLGTAVASGDVPANHAQLACLDGSSHWQLSTIGNAPSGGGAWTASVSQTPYFGTANVQPTATAAMLHGATAGGLTGTGLGVGGTEFGAAPVFFDGYQPAGAVTFGASCASGTTASCTIVGGTGLDPNGGVIWAGPGDGSNDGEWIKYGAATSTTITTLTRGYWGSTAATHGNTVPIQLVIHAWTSSATTAPYMIEMQNGAVWIDPGAAASNNAGTGPGLFTDATIYDIAGQLCLTGAANGKDCITINTAAVNITNDSGNTTAGFGGNNLQYSIANQTISTTATLTAVLNATTPVMAKNGAAAAAGTAGVLTSHCKAIWSQATGGTIAFAVNLSAAVTRLDITEVDYDGAAGIVGSSYPKQNVTASGTSTAIGTVTPTAFGTVYFSNIDLTLNPGTSNNITVQLYAESSSSSDTLTLYPGTGCSSWQ